MELFTQALRDTAENWQDVFRKRHSASPRRGKTQAISCHNYTAHTLLQQSMERSPAIKVVHVYSLESEGARSHCAFEGRKPSFPRELRTLTFGCCEYVVSYRWNYCTSPKPAASGDISATLQSDRLVLPGMAGVSGIACSMIEPSVV